MADGVKLKKNMNIGFQVKQLLLQLSEVNAICFHAISPQANFNQFSLSISV